MRTWLWLIPISNVLLGMINDLPHKSTVFKPWLTIIPTMSHERDHGQSRLLCIVDQYRRPLLLATVCHAFHCDNDSWPFLAEHRVAADHYRVIPSHKRSNGGWDHSLLRSIKTAFANHCYQPLPSTTVNLSLRPAALTCVAARHLAWPSRFEQGYCKHGHAWTWREEWDTRPDLRIKRCIFL